MWWQERLSDFVTLLVVINPLAAVPIFLAATTGLDAKHHRTLALHAVLVSLGVLIFFIVGGGFLLKNMGIAIRSFQIAGGIVLFIFAVTMVIGSGAAQRAGAADDSVFTRAVYPLAIPKIAGPGAMLTVMILSDDDRASITEKAVLVGILLAVLLIQLLVLLAAGPIARLIGEGGINVVSRVFGMLLAALAVNIIIAALVGWLGLPKP